MINFRIGLLRKFNYNDAMAFTLRSEAMVVIKSLKGANDPKFLNPIVMFHIQPFFRRINNKTFI